MGMDVANLLQEQSTWLVALAKCFKRDQGPSKQIACWYSGVRECNYFLC